MMAAASNVAATAAPYTNVPLAALSGVVLAMADVLLAGAPRPSPLPPHLLLPASIGVCASGPPPLPHPLLPCRKMTTRAKKAKKRRRTTSTSPTSPTSPTTLAAATVITMGQARLRPTHQPDPPPPLRDHALVCTSAPTGGFGNTLLSQMMVY